MAGFWPRPERSAALTSPMALFHDQGVLVCEGLLRRSTATYSWREIARTITIAHRTFGSKYIVFKIILIHVCDYNRSILYIHIL